MSEELIFNWESNEIVNEEIEHIIKNPFDFFEFKNNIDEKFVSVYEEYKDSEEKFKKILTNKDMLKDFKSYLFTYILDDDNFWKIKFEDELHLIEHRIERIYPEISHKWVGKAENIGWRNVTGQGIINALNYRDLLDQITPGGPSTIKVYLIDKEHIKCEIYHHDTGLKPDLYHFYPIEYFIKNDLYTENEKELVKLI